MAHAGVWRALGALGAWVDERWRIIEGDCRDVLAVIETASVDAVVCDPPYELGFMGKAWDGSGIAYDPRVWSEALRVLKPGGHLVAFGGSRTYHRLAVAVEDAGFEIRDQLQWLYGSGFPKSLDVSKAIDKAAGATREVVSSYAASGTARTLTGGNYGGGGNNLEERDRIYQTAPATPDAAQWDGWGTALKPAHEPIVLARKPLSEKTVAANVLRWGTGALNIDAGRIQSTDDLSRVNRDADVLSWGGTYGAGSNKAAQRKAQGLSAAGRWPANVILSHSLFCVPVGTRRVKGSHDAGPALPSGAFGEHGIYGTANGQRDTPPVKYTDADGYETVEAWECAPDCPVAMLDAQSGERKSGGFRGVVQQPASDRIYAHGLDSRERVRADREPNSGGASRFFYTAKASRRERDAGLADMDERPLFWSAGTQNPGSFQSPNTNRAARNDHPTVKPIALMRYLCRLVTPPGGLVLDPFMGSGSTLIAATLEGFRSLGVDNDAHYCAIARGRLGAIAEGAIV